MKFKIKELIHELKHHLPFTALATLIAIIFAIVLKKFIIGLSENLFEGFHFIHIILAAITSSAMFFKYKQKVFYAILIGMGASIIIGSISDIIFPYLGSFVFGLNPEFHLPLIESPSKVILVGFIGGLIGVIFKRTKVPHFLHVWISVLASMFYLISYVPVINLYFFLVSLITIIVSVVIPCCIGDIIFPFLFLKEKIKQCNCH